MFMCYHDFNRLQNVINNKKLTNKQKQTNSDVALDDTFALEHSQASFILCVVGTCVPASDFMCDF